MISTVDAANGKWGIIFDHFGLPPIDPHRHYPGECPICGKRGRLRIDDRDGSGSWICVCGAGRGMSLIQGATGMEFAECAKIIDGIIGRTPSWEKGPASAPNRFVTFFKSQKRIAGTDGEDYLRSRKIGVLPDRASRWSDGIFHHEAGRKIPGIYSIASDHSGNAVYAHATYIENGRKFEFNGLPARKSFRIREYHGPAAIKLFGHDGVLGIAEGIETALSAAEIFGIPCWSVLNASLMRRFRPPRGVIELNVFADNDRHGRGIAAATHVACQSLHCKNDLTHVNILYPEHGDFNDYIFMGWSEYKKITFYR